MTGWILGVLLLFVCQTLLPPSIRYLGSGWGLRKRLLLALGPRDEQPEISQRGARAQRALDNLQEALPVFLTLALLHARTPQPALPAAYGAALFLAARVFYVPTYLIGVLGVRSLLWVASWVGLVMMLTSLG